MPGGWRRGGAGRNVRLCYRACATRLSTRRKGSCETASEQQSQQRCLNAVACLPFRRADRGDVNCLQGGGGSGMR